MVMQQRLTPQVREGLRKRAGQIGFMFVVQAVILFGGAGTLRWAQAWVYLAVLLLGVLANAWLMLGSSPETIARRASATGLRRWDAAVAGVYGVAYYLLVPLVAALDKRFGWTPPLPGWLWLTALALFSAGFALFSWAMTSNAYFAQIVRVEATGHRICSTGPYRYVRHPGYVGAILEALALPLVLGSFWALLPGLVAAAAMVTRTALEDKTLRAEAPGYADFAQVTPHRLLPGIW